MNYQKAYERKIGSARINVGKAVAGSVINCRLAYKVGELGIDDSGSMKVLFRIVSDCADPQFDDPKLGNFVEITSSNKNVKIALTAKSAGLFGKVHERPWSKGFVFGFSGDSLSKGDEIYINFSNWRVQTFIEKTFEFKILVDPFASARFIELSNSPTMEIIPDIPEKLVVLAPSVVKKGDKFNFMIKLEDKWGNPCTNLAGTFVVSDSEFLEVSGEVGFKKGRTLVSAMAGQDSVAYLTAKYNNLVALSNPVRISDNPEFNYFWADLHGQSEETVGTNDIADYFNFAKDYAFLDVAGHQANDFQVTNTFWQKINETTKKVTTTGTFVAFPGYEWSGNTPNGGDRNVLYLNEGEKIFRSSHALIDDFEDLNLDTQTATDLFEKLPKKGAITLAHVGGRYSNLAMHDKDLEPAVEIHSDWGTFEWFYFDALSKGYKVGVVANSDGHDGRLGASYPGLGHFHTYGGLTCILSTELSRDKIFEAIYKRHVYATTGARIYLNIICLDGNKKVAMFGDEAKVSDQVVVKITALGTFPVDRIEVYDKAKLLKTFYPPLSKTDGKKTIKLVWSGANTKGRRRSFAWTGEIDIAGNTVISHTEINLFNTSSLLRNGSKIIWNGVTTGGAQGVILNLANSAGNIRGNVNGRQLNIGVSELGQSPVRFDMGGLDARLEINTTETTDIPGNFEMELPLKLTKGDHAVFVKVIQKDGHMAWSSPLFLSR